MKKAAKKAAKKASKKASKKRASTPRPPPVMRGDFPRTRISENEQQDPRKLLAEVTRLRVAGRKWVTVALRRARRLMREHHKSQRVALRAAQRLEREQLREIGRARIEAIKASAKTGAERARALKAALAENKRSEKWASGTYSRAGAVLERKQRAAYRRAKINEPKSEALHDIEPHLHAAFSKLAKTGKYKGLSSHKLQEKFNEELENSGGEIEQAAFREHERAGEKELTRLLKEQAAEYKAHRELGTEHRRATRALHAHEIKKSLARAKTDTVAREIAEKAPF
jgi:hypothetical protein